MSDLIWTLVVTGVVVVILFASVAFLLDNIDKM